jgi:hypothetical protein
MFEIMELQKPHMAYITCVAFLSLKKEISDFKVHSIDFFFIAILFSKFHLNIFDWVL